LLEIKKQKERKALQFAKYRKSDMVQEIKWHGRKVEQKALHYTKYFGNGMIKEATWHQHKKSKKEWSAKIASVNSELKEHFKEKPLK
jgi:hypothetical protein